MVIGPRELSHGAALVRLCRDTTQGGIRIRANSVGRSAYVLDETVALYIKYSEKRMGPWHFNFSSMHQTEVLDLNNEFREVFVALVCGTDGIACVTYAEYKKLLDDDFRPMEWIKAMRRPRSQYTLTGSDVVSAFKVADGDYPSRIFAALHDEG